MVFELQKFLLINILAWFLSLNQKINRCFFHRDLLQEHSLNLWDDKTQKAFMLALEQSWKKTASVKGVEGLTAGAVEAAVSVASCV